MNAFQDDSSDDEATKAKTARSNVRALKGDRRRGPCPYCRRRYCNCDDPDPDGEFDGSC